MSETTIAPSETEHQDPPLSWWRMQAHNLRSENPEIRELAMGSIMGLGRLGLADFIDRATSDQMTKLNNRQMFIEVVDNLLQSPNPDEHWRVLTFDLINFKYEVNDPRGQAVGDEVLIQFANGLGQSLRPVTITDEPAENEIFDLSRASSTETQLNHLPGEPSRLGGDEFAALLGGNVKLKHISKPRVREITLGALTYAPLVDYLGREGINGLGVRVATTMVDPSRHTCYQDVLSNADPKKHTMAAYSLVRNRDGILVPVEGIMYPKRNEPRRLVR